MTKSEISQMHNALAGNQTWGSTMATLNFITKALALKFSRKYPNIYNNYYFTNFQIVLYHVSILGPSCFDPNTIPL